MVCAGPHSPKCVARVVCEGGPEEIERQAAAAQKALQNVWMTMMMVMMVMGVVTVMVLIADAGAGAGGADGGGGGGGSGEQDRDRHGCLH